ncbi:RND family efflux transporter, MFP subunit [Anaerovirgula multivorans]|uniref:RND family efflux transporter, MFP subunit n=1 Tax=Anaerovirgula multivorans TaxID=312168 RepID=A0A239CEY0_9FIRM|nr:efflux RND transporter periplasmic adaptor subunit [Anaerovirgula multivorans]SNS18785.1 RND family efflux transporter, MFP subunit [Anaerovirgula multivorans]
MRKKIISKLLLVLLIVTVLVTGCRRNVPEEVSTEEEDYIPVEIETVKEDTLASRISLNGKVQANEEVMVMPKMAATVSRVNVKLGDSVTKDQVLFVMDQKDAERAIEQAQESIDLAQKGIDQAENSINSTKIQYESTKEKLEDALVTLERIKALYEAGAVPKSQLEQAELAASTRSLEIVEAQVKQEEVGYQRALNQLIQAESSYEHAKSNLDNTLVKAPITGVISSLNVVEGQLASSAQAAATIVDLDKVYLQVDVAENMVNRLELGQEVGVTIAAASEKEIVGKIDYISSTPDDRTQLYTVKAYIPNKDQRIKPGMSGSIGLNIESRQNVLAVRSGAVIDKEEEKVIYLVRDEQAVEQKVTLGLDTGSHIEVVEGLQAGDVIIVKGQQYVTDGQRVKAVRGE